MSGKDKNRDRSSPRFLFGQMVLPLLVLPLLSCGPAIPQPKITTIDIGPEILRQDVKRLGINLSGQSFYDSGQLLRNLTFRNPGFEGETWSSILRCKAITAATCADQNQYSTWPAGFLTGAHYEFLSGPAKGVAGTVLASSSATPDHGVVLTLDRTGSAIAGDFLLVRIDKPGGAEAGWWPSLTGGATLRTEFRDLSPKSPGRQALRIEASEPGQSVDLYSYFDSTEGRSFLQLHSTLTLSFRAKLLLAGRKQNIVVTFERLDTRRGRHTFFNQVVPLSSVWQDFTFRVPANDVPRAVGTLALTFTFAGTSALLDDVSLTAPAAANNPTAFRDEVVQTLRDLRPGVLRSMDNGTNFGASLDDLLTPPLGRRRTGYSTRATVQEDIPIGLHEFLVLCQAIGAEPWYSMPPVTTPTEAAALVEYLTGSTKSHYGAIRAHLGQAEPWTAIFPAIHLELGNEQWNYNSFAGGTLNDPGAYGERAAEVFAALRHAPGFDPSRFDLVLGSWATVPWWTEQEIAGGSGFTTVALAPYLFNDFEDASSPETIFGAMFAEPEFINSRAGGYMSDQARVLHEVCRTGALPSLHGCQPRSPGFPRLAVYETNLGALTGSSSITQADLDRTLPSMGAGLAVADNMLLMLRDLGITTQCLFALPEYLNNFSAPGLRRMVPLWGAVVDMGGPTNLRRPQFLAEQLINQAILPTMLGTHISGPNPTWNQGESRNGKIKLSGAHLLQTFAFAGGSRRSLILLNLSRTDTLSVAFAGTSSPRGLVKQTRLTSAHISDTNETFATVVPHTTDLQDFNAATPYALPPFSMTVLAWQSTR